jgi:ribosome biogenesis GTPase A
MEKLNQIKDEHRIVGAQSTNKKLKITNQNNTNSVIVSVMGYPNVGKSTIINSLRNLYHKKDTAVTGKLAGVTRHISYFALQSKDDRAVSSSLYLLDTPGIFVPANTNMNENENNDEYLCQLMKLAMCGCIADHVLGLREISDFILFLLNQTQQFEYLKYCNLSQMSDDIDHVLNSLAHHAPQFVYSNKSKKGKAYLKELFDPIQNRTIVEYDEQTTCSLFIDLFRNARFSQTIFDQLS